MKKNNSSTGDWSTGDRSTGHCSTGDCSTGHCSTGDCSTGYRSTGSCSTGRWSTGYFSMGDFSTGDWSISNYSTGHFSTIDYTGYGAFNKPCTVDEWESAEKPNFIYFDLTVWINEDDMTEKEKAENSSYKTTGGYLKVYEYKGAWGKAYENATEKDIKLLKALPNFDAEVFKEISGIDVNKKHKIVLDGKEMEIDEESYQNIKEQLIN